MTRVLDFASSLFGSLAALTLAFGWVVTSSLTVANEPAALHIYCPDQGCGGNDCYAGAPRDCPNGECGPCAYDEIGPGEYACACS